MTHRVFSRNASSSRAIPIDRLLTDILMDPAIPVHWGRNQSGMQAPEALTEDEAVRAAETWLRARSEAVIWARRMADLGVHKQIVNRIIEPWCHINVIVTSTEWANFFALRIHKDAQPEIHVLAFKMKQAMDASEPKSLVVGAWHLPYVDQSAEGDAIFKHHFGDMNTFGPGEMLAVQETFVKLSVARCARVSYLTHEGKEPDIASDLALYDRLMNSVPLHASPAEHQATPDWLLAITRFNKPKVWRHEPEHGNFVGWRQYRKMLPNENVKDR